MNISSLSFVVCAGVLIVTSAIVWLVGRASIRDQRPIYLPALVTLFAIIGITIWFTSSAFLPGVGILLVGLELIGGVAVILFLTLRRGPFQVRALKASTIVLAIYLILFGDVLVGDVAFQSLCRNSGGTAIIESKEVDGFAEAPGDYGCVFCYERLGRQGYSFVESQVRWSNIKGLASKPGIYRFSQVKKGNPACELYETEMKTKGEIYRRNIARQYGLQEDFCVASYPLEKFTADYVYKRTRTQRNIGFVLIDQDTQTVLERSTSKVLGMHTSYRVHGGWLAWFFDSQSNGNSCHEQIRDQFLLAVLRPMNSNKGL
jgi:hypothetical protein